MLARTRKAYLERIKIGLVISGAVLVLVRLLSPFIVASGMGSVISLLQGACLLVVLYAAWQLVSPKSHGFRKCPLAQDTLATLKHSLSEQGWQILQDRGSEREAARFYVGDILGVPEVDPP